MNDTEPKREQHFQIYNEYRLYVTPEFYLLTYRDCDLVKVMRRGHEQSPGWTLLLVEILWELVRGTRTALRDRWALGEANYTAEAGSLDWKCRCAHRRVLEFWFMRQRAQVKGEEPNQ